MFVTYLSKAHICLYILKMTTESAVKLISNTEAKKWPSSKEAGMYVPPSDSVAAQELGMLLRGNKYHGSGKDGVPNRSESAPPSIEGSFTAFGDIFGQQNPISSSEMSWQSLCTLGNADPAEHHCSDPAYVSYYYSNINLNPRVPPPINSQETQRLVAWSRDGKKFRTSFDDSSSESSYLSSSALSTHKEEPGEEGPPSGHLVKNAGSGEIARNVRSILHSDASTGRHKSLVDLIQADFPRTPSPVYNQPCSSNVAFEEDPVSDSHPKLFCNSLSKMPAPVITSGTVHPSSSVLGVSVGELATDTNPPACAPTSSSQCGPALMSGIGAKIDANSPDSQSSDASLLDNSSSSDIAVPVDTLRGLSISGLPYACDLKRQNDRRNAQRSGSSPYNLQRGHLSQGRPQSQTLSEWRNLVHGGMDQPSLGNPDVSPALLQPIEVQPVLQLGGINPHLYSAATTYMSSGSLLYHNLQPANVYAPQYNLGGYAVNASLVPPYLASYAPQRVTPLTYDNYARASFPAQPPGGTLGVNITPRIGHLGLSLQPSFGDPFFYLPLPMGEPYIAGPHYDPLAYKGVPMGNQIESFDASKASVAALCADKNHHFFSPGPIHIPNSGKEAFTSTGYHGSPRAMGLVMPFLPSPLGTLPFAGTPVAGTNSSGRQSDNTRSPFGSARNLGAYSSWQSSSGCDKINDPKYSILEELKSSNARRLELSDISGRIVEFSSDQHGSRFIQQKLENCSAEEKASVFDEVVPHASVLTTDVFGNYIIQKFFEHGSAEQSKELAEQLTGHVLRLSLQMYGCRVIQKALEVVDLNQKVQLVMELDGHVMQCILDQNGNHVIQKCIECVPAEKIEFIISAFRGQVCSLSKHAYGCRVIQRVLEHCTEESQSQFIIDEILESVCLLAQDQYGNYVTQHILEKGKPHERSTIINKMAGQIVQLSQHKYASNVIEKCLQHGDAAERELLIDEILGQTEGNDNLLIMMKDQFANYVVQKVLETCSDQQREVLLSRVRLHLHALKKYTYGKHIVARVEQLLYGGDAMARESTLS